MPHYFGGPAAWQQQDSWDGRGFRAPHQALRVWKTVHDRIPDEFHAQLRNSFCIPLLLEREDAQHQITVACHLVGATLAGSPDLGRNILDDPWVPVMKPPRMRARVFLDRVSKTEVEPLEVHTNDRVRLALVSTSAN